MKQAKELLLKQLDKVGARSDTLLSLVEDMATGSQLTEEEKALFKAPQFQEIVDAATDMDPSNPEGTKDSGASMSATLVAPGIGGVRKDGVVKDQKISVELAQLDKSARLDFKEGRYAEAETGFLEYLRYRPRSVSCPLQSRRIENCGEKLHRSRVFPGESPRGARRFPASPTTCLGGHTTCRVNSMTLSRSWRQV